MKSIPISFVAVAMTLLILAAACTTEKTVYVLPDGTEVTPTAAQATQAAGGDSQDAALQPAATSTQPTPAPVSSASQNAAKPEESQPSQPPSAANPRWNDKRNTLCSSLGLDASLCEKIALNQTGPDGDEPEIDLPEEPEATPVPVDNVGAATGELNEIVASEGEVSIQVLTYTESLIQQAADAVVQAEQELANQEATAAYLDAKKQELQELRQTYARLLERIGVAQDRSLAIAEQIEQEHLQFSIERANGEALIRYKDARLAHTNALAEAERNAVAQIEGIAAANELASANEADIVGLAPLYAAKDKAQTRFEEGLQEFENRIQEYEREWLAAYEYYAADRSDRPEFPNSIRDGRRSGDYNHQFRAYMARYWNYNGGWGTKELSSGKTSVREQGKRREDVTLTLLQKDLVDAEQALARAIAGNEKAQSEAKAYGDESSAVGIAVTNARLAVVDAYTEHGISEGKAGAIFRFTDSGEDAVTYNLSLVALNQQASANLSDFKSTLTGIVDTLNKDIQKANAIRISALEEAEDVRYASVDTDAQERQIRDDLEGVENLRTRIIAFDLIIMSVGWSGCCGRNPDESEIGFNCRFDKEGYRTVTGIGRDTYIRKHWHKEQPHDRTYTKERLDAVAAVLDSLEVWLQERINYWESQEQSQFSQSRLVECEIALHGNPDRGGVQGVREWREAIVGETTPLPE